MPSGLICKICALTINRNSASIICIGGKNSTIHSNCFLPINKLNKPTNWKCDVCVNMPSSKSHLSNSKIDQILKIINATNSKIGLLVDENKLLRDRVTTLENTIKHLETTSSATGIPDFILIN